MKRFALVLTVLLIGASSYAQMTPPKTMKMKVAIGLGWSLCPERKVLPGLDEAYLCSGLSAVPRTIEVEMQNQKAANPNWTFYQGPYEQTTTFKDISVKLEALVMYAKLDNGVTAFIDGRLISTQNGVSAQPIYFRASAAGGAQNFTYSSTYGTMNKVPLSDGSKAEFSPYMTIAAPE